MKTSLLLLFVQFTAVGLPGCEQKMADAEDVAADRWVGRWNGPEGTWLEIHGAGANFDITIRDLDRARTFAGTASGERLVFQRDGTQESLKASNGDETGMKWLAGKTDCLTIKPGEGFCRD